MNFYNIRFLPVFIIIFSICSCTNDKIYRAYDGEPLPKDAIATVMVYNKSSYDIIIHSLDGKKLTGLLGTSPKHIEVEQGLHTFVIGFRGYEQPPSVIKGRYHDSFELFTECYSEDTVPVSFFAKPGKTYLIDIKLVKSDEHDVYSQYWSPILYECQ